MYGTRQAESPARSPSLPLATLLPAGVVVVESRRAAPLESLTAAERSLVASASARRKLDFATGRWCARKALVQLGIEGFSLLADARRAPLWPDGIVGSITHADGFCAAAAARSGEFAGLGIDAALDGSVGFELWRQLFTPDEIEWLKGLPGAQRERMATVLFSAKEAFFKCQYAITGAWLDFTACQVTVEDTAWCIRVLAPRGVFAGFREPVCGGSALTGEHVLTAVVIRA